MLVSGQVVLVAWPEQSHPLSSFPRRLTSRHVKGLSRHRWCIGVGQGRGAPRMARQFSQGSDTALTDSSAVKARQRSRLRSHHLVFLST